MNSISEHFIAKAKSPVDLGKALSVFLSTGPVFHVDSKGVESLVETRARVDVIGNLAVYVYAQDHNPPHFHVIGSDFEASFRLTNGKLLKGRFPVKDQRVVEYWFNQHSNRIIEFWNSMNLTQA